MACNTSETSHKKLDEQTRKEEEEKEDEHRKKMDEYDEMIQQLEAQKDEVVKNGCERLQALKQQREEMKEQLHHAASTQNETINSYKVGLVDQMAVHKKKLSELQKRLVEERRKFAYKQGYVHQMRNKIDRDEDLHRQEMQTFKQLISETEANITRLEKKHDVIKDRYKHEADAKVHAHKQQKNTLKKKIELVEMGIKKSSTDFKHRKEALLKQKKQLENELDEELSKKTELTPLRKEKDKLMKELQKKLDKIKAIRNKDEEDTEKMIQKYEETFSENQRKFDEERDKLETEVFELECELQDQELLLDKLRADNTHKLTIFEHELDEQLRDREDELQEKEDKNRKELTRIEDKDDIKELEEQVHQKTLELQNVEANQQAEENLLRVWLEAVTDRENYLRGELSAKEARYASKLSSIDSELNVAKNQAESEQRQHELMKEDMEKKLQEKRDQFEDQTREAAGRLNAVNNQIAELKRSLLKREEEARERGADIERRVADETKRLLKIKSFCDEQIEPLRQKHNELKSKIIDEKDKHQKRLNGLRDEHSQQSKLLEAELNELYEKLDALRQEFKEQRQRLQKQLDEILAENDCIREKHQREIYNLNLEVVKNAMPRASEKEFREQVGAQTADNVPLNMLVEKVKDLQDEYAKKARAYQSAYNHSQEEKHDIRRKNDKEMQKIFQEIKDLNKEYLKESGRSPADLEKMKEMLESKMSELNQAKALAFAGQDSKAKLRAQIEETKKRHGTLHNELKQTLDDLHGLELRKNQEMDLFQCKLEADDLDTVTSEGSNPIQHRVQQLRTSIRDELQERSKLLGNRAKRNVSKPHSKGYYEF